MKIVADPAESPHDALAHGLVRAAALFTRSVGRLPGVAYSSIAWRVLSDLDQRGPARVSELAARQRVAQPSMTALLHRLAGEGWIERRPDPADGRASLTTITRAGVAALHDYRRAAADRVSPHLVELDGAERELLARAAELLREIGERIEEPAPHPEPDRS